MFACKGKGDLSVRRMQRTPLKLRPMKGVQMLFAVTGDDRRFLVLSDLHLGLTSRMGLRRPLPEEEAAEIRQRIGLASRMTRAHNLIILGDLKHGLFEPNVHERKAIRSLTEGLAGDFEVWVMKGNHDYGIEDAMDSRVKVVGKGGLELDHTVFIHGHSLPRLSDSLESYDMMVSGHIHPQLMIGGEWKPVWLILKGRGGRKPKKVVVLPHFSRYASRAGYRPGPPATIAPFLSRLPLDKYEYEMKDLALNVVDFGRTSNLMLMKAGGGAGRI
jgi:metallophosphoesterase superfamily enzyme